MSSRLLKAIFAVLWRCSSSPTERCGSSPGTTAGRVATISWQPCEMGSAWSASVGPAGGDSVRLEESRTAAWTVNGYPADSAPWSGSLTEGLDTAQVGRLVARSASQPRAPRESRTTSALAHRDWPGRRSGHQHFLLGGGGTDGRYVRFPPSDEVFAVPVASMRLLETVGGGVAESGSWRMWTPQIVNRIEVRRDDEPAAGPHGSGHRESQPHPGVVGGADRRHCNRGKRSCGSPQT